MFCKIFVKYITSWRVKNLNEGHTLKHQSVMPAQVFGPNGRLVAVCIMLLGNGDVLTVPKGLI
jgi:hypothetical protein